MSILQVKNLPEELHAKLAARAKAEGTTMSALAITALERFLNEPAATAWYRQLKASQAGLPPLEVSHTLWALDQVRAEIDGDDVTNAAAV